jgi:hypothetical protein
MRSIRRNLPLMTFALCFALLSAAEALGQAVRGPNLTARRVVASGRLIGTRELQRVITWQTRGNAHLAIETSGPPARLLWQTAAVDAPFRINSVRVSDLDGDGLPEIIALWWKRSSPGAHLRVIHWDRRQDTFVELHSEDEINRVRSYRVVRVPGNRSASRIVIERSEGGSRRSSSDIAYELRGSRLIRVGGGRIVPTQGESGIEGQAVIGPVRPGPQREGVPSTAPYKTTLVVWTAEGDREVRRFETGSDGRFRVALPPGTYRVGQLRQTGRFQPRAAEETVTVEPGKYARVTISFDSGMR